MLKLKLLTCQEVATLASDYLDKHVDAKITFKMRVHLMMCANCRRFIKHLNITKEVVPTFFYNNAEDVNVEEILKRIKAKQ